jgi:hypothetical protein
MGCFTCRLRRLCFSKIPKAFFPHRKAYNKDLSVSLQPPLTVNVKEHRGNTCFYKILESISDQRIIAEIESSSAVHM